MKALAALALVPLAIACSRGAQLRMPDVDDAVLSEEQGVLGAEVLRNHVAMQIELLDVGLRLRRGAVQLCEDQQSPILGILAWRRNDLKLRQLKVLGERELGLGDRPRVLYVHPDFAGARAGVRQGDFLRSLNGARLARSGDLWKQVRDAAPGTLALEIEREGRTERLQVEREPGCQQRALLSESDQIAAGVTRDHDIVVSQAMVRFAQGADQLAGAIAHEMAHAILDFEQDKPDADDYRDRPLEWQRFRLQRELDADLLALRILAMADYEGAAHVTLTERLGVEHPWTLMTGFPARRDLPGHPFVPARLLTMRDALAAD